MKILPVKSELRRAHGQVVVCGISVDDNELDLREAASRSLRAAKSVRSQIPRETDAVYRALAVRAAVQRLAAAMALRNRARAVSGRWKNKEGRT